MKLSLDRVQIGPDRTSATVDDREVTADSPKALRSALAGALYDVFHAGRAPAAGPRPKSIRDSAFERELRVMVPHPLSSVLAPVAPGASDVVQLSGVRVRIPEPQLGAEVDTPAGPARWVNLPAVLPRVSPGFLLVNGSAGADMRPSAHVRLYVGAETADAAPELWGAVLTRLERLRVPYRAKVLSARDLYPRRDSIVVYLGSRAWHAVPDIAEAAAAAGGLRGDASAYVAEVGPGIGWAWEPQDDRPGMRGLSFGEHRSHAIAAGLLAYARQGGDRDEEVTVALRAAGIEPDALYRNADSPPLPFEISGPERVRNPKAGEEEVNSCPPTS
ncbi:T3SS effector HopA1 family protein [Acrocarpospora sp. B8E8]|uniref:T3SS effector HopA1 family protein n=1 Tax=Acrocarpospora sp. B8E8 TaxID=3153572 RepID=UPI00325E62D5